MLVPFESLADHSRLWIYQADRKLTSDEVRIISDRLSTFTTSWSAHGVPLKASFDLRFDQIIVVAADERVHEASGCSIDDSVRAVKGIAQELNLDLFDRTSIAFLEGDQVRLIKLANLKTSLEAGEWNAESTFINNLVSTKRELAKSWLVPAGSSWLKRYLPIERLAG